MAPGPISTPNHKTLAHVPLLVTLVLLSHIPPDVVGVKIVAFSDNVTTFNSEFLRDLSVVFPQCVCVCELHERNNIGGAVRVFTKDNFTMDFVDPAHSSDHTHFFFPEGKLCTLFIDNELRPLQFRYSSNGFEYMAFLSNEMMDNARCYVVPLVDHTGPCILNVCESLGRATSSLPSARSLSTDLRVKYLVSYVYYSATSSGACFQCAFLHALLTRERGNAPPSTVHGSYGVSEELSG